jgi:tetratricopeptide (TPR) repeat protein
MKSIANERGWLGRARIALNEGRGGLWPGLVLLVGLVAARGAQSEALQPPAQPELPPPTTPREYVNAGTAKLREGKLREAETFLETAVATQREWVQPVALYNLGHVRFGQGLEELKKGPAAGPTAARARAVSAAVDEALAGADEALAGNDLRQLIAAYLRGRGTRKELKAATQAVRRALQAHGNALNKWQRASGDFKSTVELDPKAADARHNAEVVDRHIARLVDSLQELQQCANGMGDKSRELGEKLKQLRGRIPEEDMPPGAAGDDEEEEEQPMGPLPGQEEGPSRDGQEMPMSPEQAGWLLEGFRLDGDRRLPMGVDQTAEPRTRNRPTW